MTDKRKHLRRLVEAPEILVLPGDADRATERPDLLVTFGEVNRIMGLDQLNVLEDKYK